MFFRAVLTSVQFSSSRKVGHEHSAGCLILDENKSEIELTGHLTNVVNSISGLPTAKPKASRRHKSALQSVLISLCVSIRRKKEKKKQSNCCEEAKIATSSSDEVFTSEPRAPVHLHASSRALGSFGISQLYFPPNCLISLSSHRWQSMILYLCCYLRFSITPKISLFKN